MKTLGSSLPIYTLKNLLKKFPGGMPPDPPSIRGSLRDPQTTNLLVRNYRLLHQCVGISGGEAGGVSHPNPSLAGGGGGRGGRVVLTRLVRESPVFKGPAHAGAPTLQIGWGIAGVAN